MVCLYNLFIHFIKHLKLTNAKNCRRSNMNPKTKYSLIMQFKKVPSDPKRLCKVREVDAAGGQSKF
jgi:hypothetical protein